MRGGQSRGAEPFPPPALGCAQPLQCFLCSLFSCCCPPSPPVASAAPMIPCHAQGHLTYRKSKDKGCTPPPPRALPAPGPHSPTGRGPPRYLISSRSPSSLPHRQTKRSPAKSQRIYCIYSRQSRKKFRFFHSGLFARSLGNFRSQSFRDLATHH